MITLWRCEAVHYYAIYGGDKGKKAIVQGFGNVGSAAAFT
jgi:glutamate dehydrogenase/leucine dehydrogenase